MLLNWYYCAGTNPLSIALLRPKITSQNVACNLYLNRILVVLSHAALTNRG